MIQSDTGPIRSTRQPKIVGWVEILGVQIHKVRMSDVLSLLEHMIESGERHHVMTVNPEFVMIAQRNQQFRSVLNNASLLFPDGIGLVLASGLLGGKLPERVAGVDVVEKFASIAGEKEYRMFLLGAAPGVAERAAAMLQQRYPRLIIAGTYAGSPHPSEEEEICRRINDVSPHMLLVAYGPPHQDLWIARNFYRINVPVSMGVGGTFDFIAHVIPRAPLMVRKSGLEWLYRLVRQPHRWRRMLALPRFAFLVARERLRAGVYPKSGVSEVTMQCSFAQRTLGADLGDQGKGVR